MRAYTAVIERCPDTEMYVESVREHWTVRLRAGDGIARET